MNIETFRRTRYAHMPQVSTKDLKGHWKLWAGLTSAGKVFDYSLNGNIGSLVSAPYPAYPGFYFDGADDEITCGVGASLYHASTFTVSAWVNTTDTVGGVATRFDDATGGYMLVIGAIAAGKPSFRVYDGAWRNVTGPDTINDGRWHHILGVCDGTNYMIYVDGVLTVGDAYVNPPTDAGTFRIGRASDVGQYLVGKIDDVMFFNVAKSAAEVRSIYEATRSRYGV